MTFLILSRRPLPKFESLGTARKCCSIANEANTPIDQFHGIARLGVQDRELRRGISIIEAAAELDGKPATVLIRVMHPVLCLKSRIVNILSPLTARRDRIAMRQAEAAVVIVKRFISDALDDDAGIKHAQDCLRHVFRYLRADQYVKVADLKTGIDPLTILKAFVNDERIDHRYRNHQIKKNISRIENRRKNRRTASAV